MMNDVKPNEKSSDNTWNSVINADRIKKIHREEVNRAVTDFLSKGGKIERLPPVQEYHVVRPFIPRTGTEYHDYLAEYLWWGVN